MWSKKKINWFKKVRSAANWTMCKLFTIFNFFSLEYNLVVLLIFEYYFHFRYNFPLRKQVCRVLKCDFFESHLIFHN